ncbi:hypothetical protein [Amycolatopsis benzoatilytica]|uniref:hypothetical protein n=1 Tax=Amycolatopsis benzoatilytica TaxID=346045 RepID=UPI000360EE3E|nr:hypothetical protein [Amycolatopsis benzoatilytica]
MRALDLAAAKAELRTVGSALLVDAKDEAAEWLEAAGRDAEAALTEARKQANEIREAAAAAGRADARRRERIRRGEARRAARRIRLSAQQEVCEEFGTRVRAELERRWRTGELTGLLDECARRLLGEGAEIGEAPGGGMTGRAGGKHVDLSLDALAARAVERVEGSVPHLWTP